MGYSGLIYAAIVAGWAAVLVPRWIRRHEEIERAREADAARGVRILDRRQGGGHGRHPVTRPPVAADTAHERPAQRAADSEPDTARSYSAAARRRRRTLAVLVLLLAGVVVLVLAGRLPAGAATPPGGALAVFLVLARRAAVQESRRRARARAAARRAARSPAPPETGKRIAVLEEPEPAPPPDPNAWEPVPVPLPTYLIKPKAAAPVVRKIDLSSPGAWTSARLNSASSITLPPRPRREIEADEPDHRRAVGD